MKHSTRNALIVIVLAIIVIYFYNHGQESKPDAIATVGLAVLKL